MVKEELEKQDSYFKNKFLRFLFNSKENVHEGIFIINTIPILYSYKQHFTFDLTMLTCYNKLNFQKNNDYEGIMLLL